MKAGVNAHCKPYSVICKAIFRSWGQFGSWAVQFPVANKAFDALLTRQSFDCEPVARSPLKSRYQDDGNNFIDPLSGKNEWHESCTFSSQFAEVDLQLTVRSSTLLMQSVPMRDQRKEEVVRCTNPFWR
jgi:hypothetical protein